MWGWYSSSSWTQSLDMMQLGICPRARGSASSVLTSAQRVMSTGGEVATNPQTGQHLSQPSSKGVPLSQNWQKKPQNESPCPGFVISWTLGLPIEMTSSGCPAHPAAHGIQRHPPEPQGLRVREQVVSQRKTTFYWWQKRQKGCWQAK